MITQSSFFNVNSKGTEWSGVDVRVMEVSVKSRLWKQIQILASLVLFNLFLISWSQYGKVPSK